MQFTKISPKIQISLMSVLARYSLVLSIVEVIDALGGRSFLVGGAVRDLFLGLDVKDLDIEVHGLSVDDLLKVLQQFGPVNSVGKSFGVLRLEALDVDWSLPRIDASGRKPEVTIDPWMDITLALKRRDLTINAMAINLVSLEIIDPFDGLKDLDDKKLRTPDIHFFVEDPLRFYRVMQFIGRFGMDPDDGLDQVCCTMSLAGVSKERISEEFEKLFLKSSCPSRGFRWLQSINRLKELLPELGALVGVVQDVQWHPEGDAFEHTMQVLDAAAGQIYKNNREKLIVMFAALCHDLGKVSTTKFIDGHWKSAGHAQESAKLAMSLLSRMTIKKEIIPIICTLVEYHMHVMFFASDNAGPAAYKRLAKKLGKDVTLEMLVALARADSRGRNPGGMVPLPHSDHDVERFYQKAQECMVLKSAEQPIVMGRDFLDIVPPGLLLGSMVKRAYEIQIDHGIKDKEEIKRLVLEEIKPQA